MGQRLIITCKDPAAHYEHNVLLHKESVKRSVFNIDHCPDRFGCAPDHSIFIPESRISEVIALLRQAKRKAAQRRRKLIREGVIGS